jgi:hypothetical protein
MFKYLNEDCFLMKNTEKKRYYSPEILEIMLDRDIILLATSDGPPDQPFAPSSSSTTSGDGETTSTDGTTSKSGFEENPFER